MKRWQAFFCKEYIDYITRGDFEGVLDNKEWKMMIDFLKEKLRIKRGQKVVEFGSSTGVFTSLMSKEYKVVGLEPVKLLWEFSQELSETLSLRDCRFLNYKIGELSFSEEFDGGFCISGLPHFLTFNELEKMFKDFNHALKRNSLFFLDFTNRERIVHNFISRLWDYSSLKNGDILYVLQENSLNLENSQLSSTWTYIYKNRGFSGSYYIEMKLFTLPEILEMANNTGFEILEILGSWFGAPYRSDSHRMILIMKKTL